jgi:hypothetical protein
MPMTRKCTCVWATSANDKSVRDGISMGGFLKKECANCRKRREAWDADAPKRKRLHRMELFREDYAKADPAYLASAPGGLIGSHKDPTKFVYAFASAQFKLWEIAYERGLKSDGYEGEEE